MEVKWMPIDGLHSGSDKSKNSHTDGDKVLALARDGTSQVGGRLLDVDLGWMAEERFALSGLHQHAASGERPARLVRQGWLCEYEIEEPEDDRPRRKNGALR